MTPSSLVALTMFAFASSVTPGPNNLMLLSSGTRFGFGRTIPHLLGVTIGFGLMILVVGIGLARLFQIYPALRLALKVASVAYLLLLAYKIATSEPPTADGVEGTGQPLGFLSAAAFQWVNPKAWTTAVTALSAYLPPAGPWVGPLLVSLVCVAVTIPSGAVWTGIGTHLRAYLDQPAKLRLFNWSAAALLVASLYPVVSGHE